MANTFTTNYSLTKSEVGANNDNWGTDLNNALTSVDSQIVRKVDKTDVVTQTSDKIAFASNTITANSSTASTLFENFQAGDVISIAGSTNNSGNHTIQSKTNAYTLVITGASFTTEAEGANNISFHLVPKYSEINIDGGNIDGATIATSDITVGSGKTLDVSSGTLTLGSNQITTASIIDSNVTTAKIADDNVTTAKIADADVTYAKIQNVSSNKVLGNNTNSAGSVTELTGSQVGSMIGNATTSSAGLMSSADKTTLDNLGNIADASYSLKSLQTFEYTSGNYSALARANATGHNGGSNRDYCDSPLDYSWSSNITGGFGVVTSVGAGDRFIWEVNGGYVYAGRAYDSVVNGTLTPTEYSPFVGIILYDHSQTYSHSTRYTNGTYVKRQFWPRTDIDIASSSFTYAQYDRQIVQHSPNFKYYLTAGGANQTYSIAPVVGVGSPDSAGYIRGLWNVSSNQPLQITVYHWQLIA